MLLPPGVSLYSGAPTTILRCYCTECIEPHRWTYILLTGSHTSLSLARPNDISYVRVRAPPLRPLSDTPRSWLHVTSGPFGTNNRALLIADGPAVDANKILHCYVAQFRLGSFIR